MSTSPQSVAPVGFITNINTMLTAITMALVSVCSTTEKSVRLVETEVDNLATLQQLRIKEDADKLKAAIS